MPDGRDWSERDVALSVNCLYGSARSYYVGLENLSIAVCDGVALVEDIIEWPSVPGCKVLKKISAARVTIDVDNIFEEIATITAPWCLRGLCGRSWRRAIGAGSTSCGIVASRQST